MPPKGSKKSIHSEGVKPKTARKPKEPAVFTPLMVDGRVPTLVAVKHEGSSLQASLSKGGSYDHTIKLTASAPFALDKTIAFTEGHEFEGLQAILVRPAKAFPFMKLPGELRTWIYIDYFASKGSLTTPITLDGKRTGTKEFFAKTYADGSKNRVALLRTSKEVCNLTTDFKPAHSADNLEIYNESKDVFYGRSLRFENTSTLIDFLSTIPVSVREQLRSIQIKTLVKTSTRQALGFLAEAKKIAKLRIEHGVANEGDPAKAAKAFYADAHKFLEAVAEAKGGDQKAAVDVLSFGKQALLLKDKNDSSKPWSQDLVAQFKDLLVGKMK